MAVVKEVYKYHNSSWGAAIPIQLDADNIDITTTTTNPGANADTSLDANDTTTNFTSNAVTVQSGDTGASAWTKFNRFRARVYSNFQSFIGKRVTTAYTSSTTDQAVYTANVFNSYMGDIVGVEGTSVPSLVDGENHSLFYYIHKLDLRYPIASSCFIIRTTIASNSSSNIYATSLTSTGTIYGAIITLSVGGTAGIGKFIFNPNTGAANTPVLIYATSASNTSWLTGSTVADTKTVSGTTYTRYHLNIASTSTTYQYTYLLSTSKLSTTKPNTNYPAPD